MFEGEKLHERACVVCKTYIGNDDEVFHDPETPKELICSLDCVFDEMREAKKKGATGDRKGSAVSGIRVL